MAFFGRKKEEDYEDEEYEYEESPRKIRDLKPEHSRKEPAKPWGKKERYIVLGILLGTILTSSLLAVSARGFKLPGLPRFSFSSFIFPNPFDEAVIKIGKDVDIDIKRSGKITTSFREKTDKLSGVYALYVIDLSNNYSFGVNENEVMQAASLIKLPVMLYVQGKVDDSKLEAMGKRSDNVVFNEMVKKFGSDTLQGYIDTLGMNKTSLSENETTPKEMGELLKTIYLNKQSLAGEVGKSEKIMNYLTDTIFEDFLVKGVPENIRVAHKYGRELHVISDAGIVFSEEPYIVVIMTDGIIENEASNIFPTLSKLVYDEMTK